MISLKDIHPLSEFQRNAKSHIKRLKKTGKPAVLTVNGRASLVVQDVASYERLVAAYAKEREVAAIQQGLIDMERGAVIPAEEVLRRFEAKFAASNARQLKRRKAS